eukprot:6711649-Alexandrium_andersonii.AAC.1
MSASLVGSEMCIRDRYRLWHLDAAQCSTPHVSPAAQHRHVRLVEQARPVSYTHLTLPTICSV